MTLTHLDDKNRPQMVDVSRKNATEREATAGGTITMSREAFDALRHNTAAKGPVLQTAVVAAILGAKRTGDLIPMCHPLGLSHLSCGVTENADECSLRLKVTAKLCGQTGVEMEALTGVSIGLLTIYDMLKAIDKSMVISDIWLEHKSGGKSGEYNRG